MACFDACQACLDALFLQVPQYTSSILLAGSLLAGVCNKLTDLVDDEGFLHAYQGSKRLLLLQIVLKIYFPAFFLLMFPYNHHAAAMLAATYSFAWMARGKVGLQSKQLENIICVLFLVPAWSVVGGFLASMASFRHTYFLVLLAHDLWLRTLRKCQISQRLPWMRDLVTELGMFRYLPLLALMTWDHTLLHGVAIVALDNLGYYLTKTAWSSARRWRSDGEMDAGCNMPVAA